MSSPVFCLLVVFNLLFVGTSQAVTKSRSIIFSVERSSSSKETFLDPIAFLTEGRLSELPNGCNDSDPTVHAFENKYLSKGREYRLIMDGHFAGEVAVLAPSTVGDAPDFIANVRTSIPYGNGFLGLATDSTILARKTYLPRQNVDAQQRELLIRTASKIFLENGVGASDVARMQADTMVKAQLSAKESDLFSIFRIRLPNDVLLASLFLVAPPGEKITPSVVWFKQTKDLEDGTDGETLDLVGHADLDGDGLDELVTRLRFYENYRYQVYKRVNGAWKKIFETKTLGCL
jgi:hypothetical protein